MANPTNPKGTRCKGSGNWQMVDWMPDDNPTDEFPQGYPGASVCIYCSHGVLLVRGTTSMGVSQAGHEGLTGRLRVHYVNKRLQTMSYARNPQKRASQ